MLLRQRPATRKKEDEESRARTRQDEKHKRNERKRGRDRDGSARPEGGCALSSARSRKRYQRARARFHPSVLINFVAVPSTSFFAFVSLSLAKLAKLDPLKRVGKLQVAVVLGIKASAKKKARTSHLCDRVRVRVRVLSTLYEIALFRAFRSSTSEFMASQGGLAKARMISAIQLFCPSEIRPISRTHPLFFSFFSFFFSFFFRLAYVRRR